MEGDTAARRPLSLAHMTPPRFALEPALVGEGPGGRVHRSRFYFCRILSVCSIILHFGFKDFMKQPI